MLRRGPAVLVLLLAAALPLPAHAQRPFEGYIAQKLMGDKGESQTMETWVKGSRMRVDMNAGDRTMSSIVDRSTGRMMILIPKSKMYLEQQMPDVEGDGEGEATVTRTGRRDVVAGHRCEIIQVKDAKGNVSEVCGATGLGNAMMTRPGQKTPAWMRGMKGFFPLRVSDGKGKVVLEVTKVEAKPVDDAMFAPPAGFRAMQAPKR
jgi:hypothetical protein